MTDQITSAIKIAYEKYLIIEEPKKKNMISEK